MAGINQEQSAEDGIYCDVIDGILMPPFFKQKRSEAYKAWTVLPDDIYITSFPKSGTTWTQHVVKLIKNNGKDDGVNTDKAMPWMEEAHPDEFKEMQSPRMFKTHMPYNLMFGGAPATSPSKFIYLARNPKDVSVSLYHHAKCFKLSDTEVAFPFSWDLFFEAFMTGQNHYGSWYDHVLPWWENKDAENILFLKYEDRKKNPRQAVEKIATFLSYNLDPDVLDSITQQSTFEAMKKNPATNWSWNKEKYTAEFVMMRKGVIGDWKNYYTPEQSKRMDEELKKQFPGTGLEFKFEEN
uniref:Sulfotransferase-like protein n=1 Tax=Halisarca dujardinii TaxID=2583056 RepID=A0AA96MMB3_HALDU|nr:sulfotransferase-like protein [Halisarca dujardinii]